MFKDTFHEKDSLLDGFTYEDLITAVVCNEPEINKQSIWKVANEIIEAQLEDAKHLLKVNLETIIENCRGRRD